MNKKCARCEKPVYPIEELKCLDKVWHKTCFKCQECGMTLNMKTYKGFNKLPYCEAHIPKAKATTVTETPEMRRLAENTKLQSQVQYHAEFEKSKGKFTQVADDPETLRIKATSKIISNVAYHGELEKKAAMEQKRGLSGDNENGHSQDPSPEPAHSPVPTPTLTQPLTNVESHKFSTSSQDSPYSARTNASTVVYSSQPNTTDDEEVVEYAWESGSNRAVKVPHSDTVNQPGRRVGSIADYDPVNDNYGSLAQAYRSSDYRPPQQQQTNYQQSQPTSQAVYQQQQQHQQQQMYQQQQQQAYQQQQQQQAYQQQQQQLAYQQQQQQQAYQQQQQARHSASGYYNQQQTASQAAHPAQAYKSPPQRQGLTFRAMYDYEAQDQDEASFLDGDLIINCTPIDEGWMTGTVQRSGKFGMVPANYLEPVN